MKVCPVCNSRCFDDMDTCYGCLHKFTEQDNKKDMEHKSNTDKIRIPEYFETEPFLNIQENDSTVKMAAHAKELKEKEEKITLKLELPKSILEKYVV